MKQEKLRELKRELESAESLISELLKMTKDLFEESAQYFQNFPEEQKESKAYQEVRDEAIALQFIKYDLDDCKSRLKDAHQNMLSAILNNDRGSETAFWRRKEVNFYEQEKGEREFSADRFLYGLRAGFPCD